MVSVAAADVYTGPGVDVTLLYLGPIGFGTFFAGLGPGIGLALLAAVCGVESSRLSGEHLAPQVLTWNAAQQLGVFLLLAVVLDAFKKRLLHEQQAARTDPLTSLSNRRAFVEAAWLELERGRRHGRPLSLLYIDCDDFKLVNDRLGHVAGDAVLSAVGRDAPAGGARPRHGGPAGRGRVRRAPPRGGPRRRRGAGRAAPGPAPRDPVRPRATR